MVQEDGLARECPPKVRIFYDVFSSWFDSFV